MPDNPGTNPAEDSFIMIRKDGTATYVPTSALGYKHPDLTQVPAPTGAAVVLAPVATSSKITIGVSPGKTNTGKELTELVYGRNGSDATGYGEWKSDPGATPPFELTNLLAGTPYVVTVSGKVGGTPFSESMTVTTLTGTTNPTPTNPEPANSVFKAFTMGASVSFAADGGFNAFFGKRCGLYSTWADNGKVWGIDTPSSEYGSNKIATLGDFDLAVAPQRRNKTNWAGAAAGDMDAIWRADLIELKAKWAGRKGTLYYDPWHELNGNWYAWSVPKGQEANFRAAAKRFRKIWNEVMGGDTRFVLVLVFNRNATQGVRAQDLIESGVWDALGVDYYDFGMKAPGSADAWATEIQRTENNGSPVGILQWIALAKSLGLPLLLQEWGVQFGDNVVFVEGMTKVFDEYRYTGTGSPAGKILGPAWHNLQGSSPDPSAGGDFFIVKGTAAYSGRPKAAKALRDWVQRSSWIRTV